MGLKNNYHIIVLKLAGGPDWVEHAVVDDGVYGERYAVRGQNLLGRHFKHLKIIVTVVLICSVYVMAMVGADVYLLFIGFEDEVLQT